MLRDAAMGDHHDANDEGLSGNPYLIRRGCPHVALTAVSEAGILNQHYLRIVDVLDITLGDRLELFGANLFIGWPAEILLDVIRLERDGQAFVRNGWIGNGNERFWRTPPSEQVVPDVVFVCNVFDGEIECANLQLPPFQSFTAGAADHVVARIRIEDEDEVPMVSE